jgi:hypothetical protein
MKQMKMFLLFPEVLYQKSYDPNVYSIYQDLGYYGEGDRFFHV